MKKTLHFLTLQTAPHLGSQRHSVEWVKVQPLLKIPFFWNSSATKMLFYCCFQTNNFIENYTNSNKLAKNFLVEGI